MRTMYSANFLFFGLIFFKSVSAGILRTTPTDINTHTARINALNVRYNQLHLDMDQFLRAFNTEYSREVNILNAQYLSTIGFTVRDVKQKQSSTSDAILERALAIGNTQNECIVAADHRLTQITYEHGVQLSTLTRESYAFHSDVTTTIFKPMLDYYHRESNQRQREILTVVGVTNLSTITEEELSGLERQYDTFRRVWEQEGQSEINTYYDFFLSITNSIKYVNFSSYYRLLNEYVVLANKIKASLVECE